MVWHTVKKCLFYLSATYLALALMGTPAFVSLDIPCFEDLVEGMDQGDFLRAFTPSVAFPAIGKATALSFSHLRHRLLYAALSAGLFSAGAGLLCAAIRLIARIAAHDKKNIILLKLRI
jgi:hypothetical protein